MESHSPTPRQCGVRSTPCCSTTTWRSRQCDGETRYGFLVPGYWFLVPDFPTRNHEPVTRWLQRAALLQPIDCERPRAVAAGDVDVAGVGDELERQAELAGDLLEFLARGEVVVVAARQQRSRRDRLHDKRLVYGMLFKNIIAAGASLEHSHSQLIVTPIVPISVVEEIEGSHAYFRYRGRCVFCDMLEQELAFEKRIVVDYPGFVAFCPFAARFPFETWIVPTGARQPLSRVCHAEGSRKNWHERCDVC